MHSGKLKASARPSDEGCFVRLQKNLVYKIEDLGFKIGDPTVLVAKEGLLTIKDKRARRYEDNLDRYSKFGETSKEALTKLLTPGNIPSGSQGAAAASTLIPVAPKTSSPQPAPSTKPTPAPKSPGSACRASATLRK